MAISPFLPPRFFARTGDETVLYATQVNRTSTLWWYGVVGPQNAPMRTHVFRGDLIPDDGGDRWEGKWIDVPKGVECRAGTASYRVVLPSEIIRLTESSAEMPDRIRSFGDERSSTFERSVARLDPGFVGDGLNNLTGVWVGDDRGTYYIREVSGTGEIAWLGEHPEAEPTTPTGGGQQWVNVFMGQREGRRISGEWTDVPKGEIPNEGRLGLAIVNENLLRIETKSGGFGGNSFRRVAELTATIRWNSLTVDDNQEWFFEGDEPYFMALIAKMDGSTVDLTAPESATVDFSQSLIAPNLRDNVGAGTVISLASMPPITMPIRPVRGATSGHAVLGIALRGAERDFSSDETRSERLQDWVETGGGEVERQLRRTGDTDLQRDAARWHERFSWTNEDDTFGMDSAEWSYGGLLALATTGTPAPISFVLRGRNVQYTVRATITASGPRSDCRP